MRYLASVSGPLSLRIQLSLTALSPMSLANESGHRPCGLLVLSSSMESTGIQRLADPLRIQRASTPAQLKGKERSTSNPPLSGACSETLPPNSCANERTACRPIPRPLTADAFDLDEKAGSKRS